MKNRENTINNYLKYCITQKRLDEKTIKAYRLDFTPFSNNNFFCPSNEFPSLACLTVLTLIYP